MIVCPRCDTPLDERPNGYACPACSYRADRDEGIVLFEPGVAADHDSYKSEGLDFLYRHEREHPWFVHRVDVIRKAFARHVRKEEDILEVGAGTGHTARALRDDGYRSISLGELHTSGLRYAKQYGLEKLYQFDLTAPPFRDQFDAVALFDVLEHIPDDRAVLRGIHRILRPEGKVLLTVPAHQWLWSRIDELSSHQRRYSRGNLTALLESHGFAVAECRYFFTALVPGLIIRALRSRNVTEETLESGAGLQMSRTGKAVLRMLCGPGDVLLAPLRRFVGGSLLAVARKQ